MNQEPLMNRLGRLTRELDDLSDDLNKTIKQYEDHLRQMGVGINASVPLLPDEPEGARISWARREGWRLMYLPKDDRHMPLLEAARAVRLRALTVLDDLTKLLVEKTEEMIGKIEKGVGP